MIGWSFSSRVSTIRAKARNTRAFFHSLGISDGVRAAQQRVMALKQVSGTDQLLAEAELLENEDNRLIEESVDILLCFFGGPLVRLRGEHHGEAMQQRLRDVIAGRCPRKRVERE